MSEMNVNMTPALDSLQGEAETANRKAEKEECAYWFAWRQLLIWTAGLDLSCYHVTTTGHARQWRPSSWTGTRICGCSRQRMWWKTRMPMHSMLQPAMRQAAMHTACTYLQRQLVHKVLHPCEC